MSRKAKQIQTITDPLLDPFFITRDDYSFTVKQMVKPNDDHFKSNGNGKAYEKTIAYYPSFDQALNKIAESKLDVEVEYTSLKSYLADYKTIQNQIKEYTNA